MFSTCDSPLHQQTPTHSLTVQMSTHTGEFEIAQTPTASRKMNSFEHEMFMPPHFFHLTHHAPLSCLVTST